MIQQTSAPSQPVVTGPNRGRLRNGNPPGDYMRAPRCGARTRAAGCSCRQPAMRNGRCRFHGGKSTGARTAAGRARCAKAPRKHGFYSAEIVALRAEARAHTRRVRHLLSGVRGGGRARRPAGHGVLPFNSRAGARCARPMPHRPANSSPGDVQRTNPQAPAAQPKKNGSIDGISAGHGVLPLFLHFARTAARWLGLEPRPPT